MNFVNILETIKGHIDFTAFETLRNDFIENAFQEEYKKLRPTKSGSEKAIAKYVSKATYKDAEKVGAYSNGYTILLLAKDQPEAEKNIKSINLAEKVLDMIKNRRPAECYFFDSIALYKALNRQQKDDYLIKIDDHFYSAALVAEMVDCIVTSKTQYIRAEICENGALMIKQTNAALILPVSCTACHPSKNANMQDFLKYLDEIEKAYIDEIRKTA